MRRHCLEDSNCIKDVVQSFSCEFVVIIVVPYICEDTRVDNDALVGNDMDVVWKPFDSFLMQPQEKGPTWSMPKQPTVAYNHPKFRQHPPLLLIMFLVVPSSVKWKSVSSFVPMHLQKTHGLLSRMLKRHIPSHCHHHHHHHWHHRSFGNTAISNHYNIMSFANASKTTNVICSRSTTDTAMGCVVLMVWVGMKCCTTASVSRGVPSLGRLWKSSWDRAIIRTTATTRRTIRCEAEWVVGRLMYRCSDGE